jgi:site-specific DNA recombinase
MSDIYVATICEAYNDQTKHLKSDRIQILSQLDHLNTRLKNAREMVADQKLDLEDFRELKSECTSKINQLEAKLSGFSKKENNIDGLLNKAVSNLSAIDVLYEEGTITERRQIIGSIFPEKLTFDGFAYRTTRINEAVRLVFSLDTGFSEMKNRKSNEFSCLSGWVVPTGLLFIFKPA